MRGVALIGVLLLIVTLSLLAGAMVAVHQGHWALSRGQDQRIAAHQACLSAVEYARDRLQADPTWGTASFGSRTVRVNLPGRLEVAEVAERVELAMAREDCQAVLQVTNNLAGGSTAAPPPSSARSLQVPPATALLVVVGRCSGQQRRLEVLLRERPPLDGALYAGDDIAFIPSAAGSDPPVEFDGEDATKNKLRSRQKIYLPTSARFLSRGAATGTGDVRVGATLTLDPASGAITDPGDGTSLSGSPGSQAALEASLNASLSVGPVPPLRLDVEDLNSASGAVHPLPPGKYTFVGPGRVQFEPSGGGPPTIYQDAIYDGGALTGSSGQLAVALAGRKFMVQGQVESDGSLELDTLGASAQAELAVGYDPEEAGAAEPGRATSLRVRGDLTVRGHVVGQGTVAALKPSPGSSQGNVVISGRSTLASGSSTGLGLFAEGDIRMKPTELTGDITLAADFEVLSIALNDPLTSNASLLPVIDTFETLPDAGLPGRDSLLGLDEFRNPALVGTGNVRDSQISQSDYTTRVQPLIPNWPTKTPGGLYDVPPEATAYLNNCLTAAPGFNGGMTVGRHTRLMAFLRSVDEGNPEIGYLTEVDWVAPPWSDPNQRYNQLVAGIVKNQLQRVAQDARLEGVTPSQWLVSAGDHYQNRQGKDIDWRGLVYAKGRLWGEGLERIDVVGALGAETGRLIFSNFRSSRVKFHHSELNPVFRQQSLRLEGYSCYLD